MTHYWRALYVITSPLFFHLGWWGRARLTHKIKSQGEAVIAEAEKMHASPEMVRKIFRSYWDML